MPSFGGKPPVSRPSKEKSSPPKQKRTKMIDFLNLFENDFLAIFPELFLIISTLILLMYGVTYSAPSVGRSHPILVENIGWIGVFALGLSLFLVVNNPLNNIVFFYNSLILDDFAVFFKSLLLIGSIFVLLISFDYLKDEKINAFEYIILALLSIASMLLFISSYDFLAMYLTIEFQSLCFYVMAASKRNSEYSTEAGLKYFILGAFSSGILLFGISIIYGFTGITNFEELTKLTISENIGNGLILGMLFVGVGFLFKLTAAPFHMWAPDVYEGAPTAVTAFFAVGPKIAILAVFTRLFMYSGPFGSITFAPDFATSEIGSISFGWEKIFVFCSIASMIVGALSALSQQKIKRLLAYSSIGHVGYLLIGLTCASLEGIESLFVYLIIYLIMTINVFAILLSLRAKPSLVSVAVPPVSGDSQFSVNQGFSNTVQVRYLSDLGLLAKTNPLLALSLTASLFSMAGIPPLAGFCSKFYLFFAALGSSLYLLAFVGVFTSVLSCFYYIRLIKIMYFEKGNEIVSFEKIDKVKALTIAFTSFFLVFFVFYPSPIFLLTHKIALSMSL